MKHLYHRSFSLFAGFFLSLLAHGQKGEYDLFLKSGQVLVAPNLSRNFLDSLNQNIFQWGKALVIIQFQELPTEQTKKQLSGGGVELLDYIPEKAFSASIRKSFDLALLNAAGVRAVIPLAPQNKLAGSLSEGVPPDYAVKVPGTVDVLLQYCRTFSLSEVLDHLKGLNVDVLSTDRAAAGILSVRLASGRLFDLAGQSFVEFLQPVPPPDVPLNNNSRALGRANLLNAAVENGGRGLNGEGITLGIGDNANVVAHVDFSGRLIDRSATSGGSAHGYHTTGTMGGAGIVNELYRGYAPKATIISQVFNGIVLNTADYVRDYGMVLTNNSYGANSSCADFGIYDLNSQYLDKLAFDFPSLQNVFAAGNSGTATCSPYGQGFSTVLGYYQASKNILCVGSTDAEGLISTSSSRGPVRDGRLKPEVTALGANVLSDWPGNTYWYDSGTSMAAPAVTGGLALLYQRYRQLHSNANPKNALMKALICNGATDRGNPGPDFTYGFGSLNLLRSLDMLENNRYINGTAANNGTSTFTIQVPANTTQLKVMLYWNDPGASLLTGKMLVNDLDLEVSGSNATYLPFILNPISTNVNDPATRGSDHTNNIEQVVVDNPQAGSYTITIKGTSVPQDAQEFFVVYDFLPNSLQLTAPAGGEALVPGEQARITWDAFGDTSSTFTLQYSPDGGTNWNNISTTLPGSSRSYSWQVPAESTERAKIRIVRNGTSLESRSQAFTIAAQPTLSLSSVQCEGYLNLNWTSVPGAANYQVMMLRGSEMVPIATTTSLSYSIGGLSKDSVYWVSVRPGINGKWGRRAVALSRQPNNGTCAGSISDNDLKLNALLTPVTGRKFTASELGSSVPVKIEVKNLDDVPVTGFVAKYSKDGGRSWVIENVPATIGAGAVYTYTFAATANLSAVGNYPFMVVVQNNVPDGVNGNDTLKALVRQLDNQPLNLSAAFTDSLEGAADTTHTTSLMGVAGLSRYDFSTSSPIGRLRTFVNSGFPYSGNRAFTLDAAQVSSGTHVNYLLGTFNLSNYDAAKQQIRLSFRFSSHGVNNPDSNLVWIRGNETAPWIPVYNWYQNLNTAAGTYQLVQRIGLSDTLRKYGQNFSSSFQIRWGQNGYLPATDPSDAGGVSFDDIGLSQVVDDVNLLGIDSSLSFVCRESPEMPLKITVRNESGKNLSNVPVRYSLNGGSWVSEVIASLPADSTLVYTFNKPMVLNNSGDFTVKAIVDYPTDSYRLNDTAATVMRSGLLITAFPYLENFELGTGGWFAGGNASSWEYGTPSSPKINRAASGAKAWKTRLSGNYNDGELSYLYSPCFNISGLKKPTLSFSMALDLENCGLSVCDAAWLEYSADGKIWKRVQDDSLSATNWYISRNQPYWSAENYTWWHVATVQLPAGLGQMRLRFVMNSDRALNREGIALDDIHIYDNPNGIYLLSTADSAVTQNISGGNDFINFTLQGKLLASIRPNNQKLGNTEVRVYKNTGNVRYTESQYYHNRSITIKPQNSSLSDSVTVRFYFSDAETEALRNANGCSTCTPPPGSAYELGISQYDDYVDSLENGTIADNLQGIWRFLPADKVRKVPFDRGYYAEFKVKDFSEFWLNAGSLNNQALPVKLLDFTVQKTNGNDVVTSWSVASEAAVSRYELEVAQGDAALQANQFTRIGSVESIGNSISQQSYSFTDTASFKTGIRYYRLKTVNKNGTFTYSVVRSVIFNSDLTWLVFPNPSVGLFNLVYLIKKDEAVSITISDPLGRTIKSYTVKGSGFVQKLPVDIADSRFAPGLYLLQVKTGPYRQSFKLFKSN